MLEGVNTKENGPRTEPCGTPRRSSPEGAVEPPKLSLKLLSDKYDLNYSETVDGWQTAVRSKSIKITESPESAGNKRSLKNLKRADSVL